MKAILMAAGLGTRLLPLTATVPKCLVPIKGVPLLGWWLKQLQQAGVTEVMINLHHLREQVIEYVGTRDWGLQVHFLQEEELLGSQGTLQACRPRLQQEESFLVAYADNLTDMDIRHFAECHINHKLVGTIGLFRSGQPQSCGIVELDADGMVIDFTEKPEAPKSDLANAGMYMFRKEIWDYVRADKRPSDIGHDLLPRLTGKLKGFHIDGFFMDIGTFASLELACRSWNYDYQ